MNLGLFKSTHALVAAALLIALWLWQVQGGFAFGWQQGSNVAYLLWTGWIAFALYVVLALYAARKSAHKTRLTPEFKMAVPIEQLEKAQLKLSDIRERIIAGELKSRAGIKRAAQRALHDGGVAKVARVVLERGRPGGPRYLIRLRSRARSRSYRASGTRLFGTISSPKSVTRSWVWTSAARWFQNASEHVRTRRCFPIDSIHRGWMRATVRAYRRLVRTSSAHITHFGFDSKSPEPGKMWNAEPCVPAYSWRSPRWPTFARRPASSGRWTAP